MAVSMSIATLNFTDDKGKTWRLCDIADLDNRYSLRRPGKIDFIFVHENMPAELLQRCLYGTYICNGSKVHKKYSPDLYSILYGAKDMTSEDEDGSTIQLISTGTDSDGEYATTPDLMTKRRFIRAAASLASVGLLEFDTIRLISGYFHITTYGNNPEDVTENYYPIKKISALFDAESGINLNRLAYSSGAGLTPSEKIMIDSSRIMPASSEVRPMSISLLPIMVA